MLGVLASVSIYNKNVNELIMFVGIFYAFMWIKEYYHILTRKYFFSACDLSNEAMDLLKRLYNDVEEKACWNCRTKILGEQRAKR